MECNSYDRFTFWFGEYFLYNKKLAITLWFGLSLFAVIHTAITMPHINNFEIYRQAFYHTIKLKNLYLYYPLEYEDVNMYGPVFSVLIAPFAILPKYIGVTIWVMFNAAMLYWAIRKLPVKHQYQNAILILSAHEMMNAASWLQINPLIAACIILGFSFIHEGKDKWGLFFILLATFIKIYGIVGFAFFFFSKDKFNFIKWCIIWSILFFIAPFVWGHPSFIIQSYYDWYAALQKKAYKNTRMDIQNDYQDISVMGMIRRIFKWQSFDDLFVFIPAVFLFAIQYLNIKYFNDLRFRLFLLCSVLIFTVVFSNGSESPTYILAFPAVCIWYILQPKSKWVTALFIFSLLLTSFSYSDIFTPYVRVHIIRPYSLKALPCFIVWLVIIVQLYSRKFLSARTKVLENLSSTTVS